MEAGCYVSQPPFLVRNTGLRCCWDSLSTNARPGSISASGPSGPTSQRSGLRGGGPQNTRSRVRHAGKGYCPPGCVRTQSWRVWREGEEARAPCTAQQTPPRRPRSFPACCLLRLPGSRSHFVGKRSAPQTAPVGTSLRPGQPCAVPSQCHPPRAGSTPALCPLTSWGPGGF